MSKYSKLIGEILDSIYEGYTLDEKTKKLKVVNESRAEKAAESVHTLVLEKARELWDQLEASEESLADVAEEISFEELNTDPSTMDLDVSRGASSRTKANKNDGEDLSSMLGETSDFDLDSIFDSMDHLDDEDGDMPYNEELGDDEEDVVDGDEEYSDLQMDNDDGYVDDDELDGDLGDDEMGNDDLGGDLGGDMGDDEIGSMGDDFDDESGDNGFDFDFDLDGDSELEGDSELDDDPYSENSEYGSDEESLDPEEEEYDLETGDEGSEYDGEEEEELY